MGTLGLLKLITEGCDNLTDSYSPMIEQTGLHMVLGLAAIMLAWWGVIEIIATARGGQGFRVEAFLNFAMLIVFTHTAVAYYTTDIPGLSFSFTGFIRDGTNNLVDTIGGDTTDAMLNSIGDSLSKSGLVSVALKAPYLLWVFAFTQLLLTVLAAASSFILAYGAVGATVISLLGPVFIPWLVFDKTEWLFWGWLKAYLGFEFYKVVAAAVMSILARVYMHYATTLIDWTHPVDTLQNVPLLAMLVFVCIFMIWKIPALTSSLFSGSTSGHDGSMGLFAAAAATVRGAL